MLKKLQNVSVYFSKNRIRYFITCFVFLVLGVAPLLPNITASGYYDYLSVEQVSQPISWFYTSFGLNIYLFPLILYFTLGAVLFVLGAVKIPKLTFGVILLVASASFLIFNILAATFIFVAVTWAETGEALRLSVFSWIYLVLQVANIVNLILFLPKLKAGR